MADVKWPAARLPLTGSELVPLIQNGKLAGAPASGLSSAGGTVTSVALTMPAQFTVAGSPITTGGTFGVNWANAPVSTVLAGPTSGSGPPVFRGLTPADLPNLTGYYLPLTGGLLSGPGNLTVGGTLGVSGAATFGGNITYGTTGWSESVVGGAYTINYSGLGNAIQVTTDGVLHTIGTVNAGGNVYAGGAFVPSGYGIIWNFPNYNQTFDPGALVYHWTGGSSGGSIMSLDSVGNLATLGNYVGNYVTANGGTFYASSPAGTTRGLQILTSGSPRWWVSADNEAETGSNAGSNFNINRYSDTAGFLGTALSINRASGDTAFSGVVTATGGPFINEWGGPWGLQITPPAGTQAGILLTKTSGVAASIESLGAGGATRWQMQLGDGTAETGGNTGSNFLLTAYTDAGGGNFNAITIDRATANTSIFGATTFSQGVTVSGVTTLNGVTNTNAIVAAANITASTFFIAAGAAGTYRGLQMGTPTQPRWIVTADSEAEGGSNAGTNFQILRYDDAGNNLGIPLSINRATGQVTFSNTALFQNGASFSGTVGVGVNTNMLFNSPPAFAAGVTLQWVGSAGWVDYVDTPTQNRVFGNGTLNALVLSPTGLATLNDLAISSTKTASQALIAPAAGGAPTWRRPASTDLSDAVGATAFTPVINFITLGDLSVTYAAQLGSYVKIGPMVLFWLVVQPSAFTYTTSAGAFRITGMPLGSSSTRYVLNVSNSTVSFPAGAYLTGQMSPAGIITLYANAAGGPPTLLTTTHFPSGWAGYVVVSGMFT